MTTCSNTEVSDERLAELLARVSPPAEGWHAGLPTLDIHSVLTELLSRRSGGVEVKALDWQPDHVGGGIRADEYRVRAGLWTHGYYWLRGEEEAHTGYPDEDAAKAAAQADFNQRILSSLHPADGEPVADFYAVQGSGGYHIGLWDDREAAEQALTDPDYVGARLIPLYTRPSNPVSAEVTVTKKIKPLEWSLLHSGYWLGTGVVNYSLWEHPNGIIDVTCDGKIIAHGLASIVEAKAAAEADYHNRILAALSTATTTLKAEDNAPVGTDNRADMAKLREALEMIAGLRPCLDNLMGNADIARVALASLNEVG